LLKLAAATLVGACRPFLMGFGCRPAAGVPGKHWQSIVSIFRPTVVDRDVLPLGIASFQAYPNGTFVYKATATDAQGQTATWEPFKRVTSQLQVVPGEIEIKKP
jgi:hypothetical protein